MYTVLMFIAVFYCVWGLLNACINVWRLVLEVAFCAYTLRNTDNCQHYTQSLYCTHCKG